MDARARAKRYEKLDFLGEGQVSDRGGAALGPGAAAAQLGPACVAARPRREGDAGGAGLCPPRARGGLGGLSLAQSVRPCSRRHLSLSPVRHRF